MADPYGDVSIVPSESLTVSPTDCPSVKPWGKVNIYTLSTLSFRISPFFSYSQLSPSGNKQPPIPSNKNLPHISTTSYISLSFVVTASVF
jgi:hypothetical protein